MEAVEDSKPSATGPGGVSSTEQQHPTLPAGSKSPGSAGRRAKPALKKHHAGAHDGSGTKSPDGGDPHKHLKWDEEVIEEHDQLRGTRMKINEPNTPYVGYDSGAESDDSRRAKSPANQKPTLSWDVLQNRLDSVAAVREQYPSSPSEDNRNANSEAEQSDGGEGEEDEDRRRQREMRNLEFKEHRKRHYNEMELVRKFRQEHPDGAVVDAEVENGEDDQGDDADAEND